MNSLLINEMSATLQHIASNINKIKKSIPLLGCDGILIGCQLKKQWLMF